MLIHTGSHTVTTKTQHSKGNTQMCTYMKYVYTYVMYVHIHKLRQANREKHKTYTQANMHTHNEEYPEQRLLMQLQLIPIPPLPH